MESTSSLVTSVDGSDFGKDGDQSHAVKPFYSSSAWDTSTAEENSGEFEVGVVSWLGTVSATTVATDMQEELHYYRSKLNMTSSEDAVGVDSRLGQHIDL